MKILFVIDHLGPAGSQRQLVTLATALKARGKEVEFFIYYPQQDHFLRALEEASIPVHVSVKRSRFDLGPPRALRRLMKSGRFDVSVSFLTTPNIYNVVAAAGMPTRTVVSERSAFPFERVPWSIRLRFGVYRFADHIVVNSRHHHDRLCHEFPWMVEKSSAIANGVDLAAFKPSHEGSNEEAKVEGDAAQTLLAVASIHAGKNYRRLIEALRIYVADYGPSLRIAWAGREPVKPGDIAEYEAAKTDLRSYDLENRWQWLGVRDDIPDLLNRYGGFIHPSLFEGLPNAVCEALAAGAPVLASNVCDHPWLVGNGERGFLFDPLDPHDIATTIRRFMVLPSEERCRLSRNARAFAEQYLAVDVFVDSYERLFDSMP